MKSFLVVRVHQYLIIPRESVHKAQQFMTRRRADQAVDVRQWKGVFWASFVQVGIVNTNSSLSIGFFDKYNICEPFGVFDFAYESDLEEFSNFLLNGLSPVLWETSFFSVLQSGRLD